MYIINNKALKIGDKLVTASDPTIIELETSGTCFPSRTASQIRFSNTGLNELYIDWNDGTPIETILMNGQYFNNYQIMHYYQDLLNPAKIGTIDENYVQRRIIKFKFKYPSKISEITIINTNLYGKFPIAIGNYNLSIKFSLSTVSYLEEFPPYFRGLNTADLSFTFITQNTITSIPEWIYNSKIKKLGLINGFLFSQIPSISNTDKLINTVGLEQLRLNGLSNESIPNNWKDISTLKVLGLGGAAFTILPTNVSLISQLKTLVISDADANGYNTNYTSWGDGIGLMTELTTLIYVGCLNNLLTTDLPTRIINCTKIKTIRCGGSFASVARTDAHITNYYNMVITNGDIITTVNNNFRNITFTIYFQPSNSARPTGTYQQPAGFVLESNNGTPASVMEMVWVLVTQYKWKITVMNSAGTNSEILQ